MVDAPTPPATPDPYQTAQAQTNSNITTALTNSALQNADVYNPFGSSVFNQVGTTTVTGPDGQSYQIPKYQNVQTLSPAEQTLFDQQTKLGAASNDLALSQIQKLQGILGQPIDTSSLSPLTTRLGYNPSVTNSIASAGPITTNANQTTNALTNVNYSNAPTTFDASGPIQASVGDNNSSRAVQNTVNAVLSRVQPQLDRNSSALQAQLANQGITPGSAAWNTAIDANNRAMNDAYMQADLTGNQEQQALFNQALQQGQFANSAQNQDFSQKQARGLFNQQGVSLNNQSALNAANFTNAGIAQNNQAALNNAAFQNQAQNQQYTQNANDAAFSNQADAQKFQELLQQAQFGNQAAAQQLQQILTLRNQPINEITALMSGGQVTAPQFAGYNSGTVDSTPVGQYVYNSAGLQNQQYNTQAQQAAATNAGLFGLGSKALGMFALSERIFKHAIEKIGEIGALSVYSFKYLWSDEPHVGVMVDEVERVRPDAVRKIGALKYVDYSALGLA